MGGVIAVNVYENQLQVNTFKLRKGDYIMNQRINLMIMLLTGYRVDTETELMTTSQALVQD